MNFQKGDRGGPGRMVPRKLREVASPESEVAVQSGETTENIH